MKTMTNSLGHKTHQIVSADGKTLLSVTDRFEGKLEVTVEHFGRLGVETLWCGRMTTDEARAEWRRRQAQGWR